jgi:hypothetical protein
MPLSGEFCIKAGTYQGEDVCKAQVTLQEAAQFPRCPVCKRDVNWVAVQPMTAGT